MPFDPIVVASFPELRARQLEFFIERLVSAEAAREWQNNLREGYLVLLATPVEELVDPDRLSDALDATLTSATCRDALRPAIEAALMLTTARLTEEERAASEFIPQAAREPLDALVVHPDLLSERLVAAVLEHPAVEEVLRDILHEALTEFSKKVNPFVAEWGIPSLLKRLGPFGFGGVSKGFESMRVEFDKRLEPEIRKFLQGFSRRSLKNLAENFSAKQRDPAFVALRRQLAAWVLEQPISALVLPHDDERLRLSREVYFQVTEHVLVTTKAERRAAIAFALKAHAKQPLGEALAVYGIRFEPDFEALAAASWDAVVALVESEPLRAWLDRLLGEFYDQLAAG